MVKPIITEYQSLLFPIAYNLLGNMDDAEDLVQETMLKWLSMDQKGIENEQAYLVRMLVNKCLNHLRDRKREQTEDVATQYEQLLVAPTPSRLDLGPTLSLGMRAMLAKLSPQERAVFLLKEVFHYSHKEIAAILDVNEAYSRQILRRAKKHIQDERERYEVDPVHHEHLVQTFVEVCEGENMAGLLEILREDIQIDIARPAAIAGTSVGRQAAGLPLMGILRGVTSFQHHWWQGMPTLVAFIGIQPICIIQLDSDGVAITRLKVEVLDMKNMRILKL